MFLVIYQRKNKLYFSTVNKLTDKLTVTNEKMETVKLGYRNKIRSYAFNGWDDFKKIYPELKERFALRILFLENRFKEKTQVKFTVMLLNNPFMDVVIKEFDEDNGVPNDEVASKAIEVFDVSDVHLAEQEFRFNADEINLEDGKTLSWFFDKESE